MKKLSSDVFDGLDIYIILGVIGMVAVPLILGNAKPKQSAEYPQTMVVTNINDFIDYVEIETSTGYTYGFWGIEDYQIGDVVAVTMNDNRTENDITDDKIVSVRFSGYTKEEVK